MSAGNFTVYLPSFATAEATTFPAASFTSMFVAFLSLVTTYLALVAVTVPSFATVTLMLCSFPFSAFATTLYSVSDTFVTVAVYFPS